MQECLLGLKPILCLMDDVTRRALLQDLEARTFMKVQSCNSPGGAAEQNP